MATNRALNSRLKLAEEKIEELENQLSENLIEREVPDYNYPCGLRAYDFYGVEHYYRPTMKIHELTTEGKINAILQHLGLELDVTEERTNVTPATVKIVKAKKSKKGKK